MGNTEEGRLKKKLNMGPLKVRLNTHRTANGVSMAYVRELNM